MGDGSGRAVARDSVGTFVVIGEVRTTGMAVDVSGWPDGWALVVLHAAIMKMMIVIIPDFLILFPLLGDISVFRPTMLMQNALA